MVDPMQLFADVTQDVALLALPPLLWLFLYLWAWQGGPESRIAGFGRRTFWLLLPGALVGSLANLPFFTWDASVLAVNIGGALIPLGLSLYLSARWIGVRPVVRSVTALAVVVTLFFGLDLLPVAPGRSGLARFAFGGFPYPPFSVPALPAVPVAYGLVAFAGLATAALLLVGEGGGAPLAGGRGSRGLVFLILAVVGVLLTFATTQAVAGVGILSTFPFYLLAPVLIGAVAVAVARPWLDLPPLAGIPLGYGAATLGVTLGADLLRQPPLYGGTAGLLSIGGAGVLDLVYLSGLIAAATGWLVVRLVEDGPARRRGAAEAADAARPPSPSPELDLREAARWAGHGGPKESLARSARAADRALAETRTLRGLGDGPAEDPWYGLGTPGWVGVDHRNLRALARTTEPHPGEAARGLRTAEQLVAIARERARVAFGSVRQRATAGALDLILVTVPAVAVWTFIALASPPGTLSLLEGVPFNTAVFGYIAYAFLYFFLAEARWGTTLGKFLLGLEVRERTLAPPGRISALLRNLPRVLPLTLVGELGAPALAVFLKGGTGVIPAASQQFVGSTALLLFLLTAAGVAAVGTVTLVALQVTDGRERVGDLWGGTWVLRRRPPLRRSPIPPGPVPRPPPTAAPEAERSG